MDETINAESKGEASHKPPQSRLRIIGEILAGAVAGLTAALPVGYVIWNADISKNPGGHFGAFKPLFIFLLVVPVVYIPATAFGVYFVGSRGKEINSFKATLIWSLLGVVVTYSIIFTPFVFVFLALPGKMGVIVQSVFLVFTPSICTTLGFNLTRSYKEPKEDVDGESNSMEVICPQCASSLGYDEAGKVYKCRHCGEIFQVGGGEK